MWKYFLLGEDISSIPLGFLHSLVDNCKIICLKKHFSKTIDAFFAQKVLFSQAQLCTYVNSRTADLSPALAV